MEELIGFIFGPGAWGVVAAALFGVVHSIISDSHAPGAARDRWIGWLHSDVSEARYRAMLAAALDWIDCKLSPDADPAHPDKTEVSRAWSHGLLNLSLLCAVVYPFLALLVQWAWTGAPGRLGSQVVLRGESAWHVRLAVIAAASFVLVGAYRLNTASNLRQHLSAVGFMYAGIALGYILQLLEFQLGLFGFGGAILLSIALGGSVFLLSIAAIAASVMLLVALKESDFDYIDIGSLGELLIFAAFSYTFKIVYAGIFALIVINIFVASRFLFDTLIFGTGFFGRHIRGRRRTRSLYSMAGQSDWQTYNMHVGLIHFAERIALRKRYAVTDVRFVRG